MQAQENWFAAIGPETQIPVIQMQLFHLQETIQ